MEIMSQTSEESSPNVLCISAFAPSPGATWTAIATRNTPPRTGNVVRAPRLRKDALVPTRQARRARISPRSVPDAETFSFLTEPITKPKNRRVVRQLAPRHPEADGSGAPAKVEERRKISKKEISPVGEVAKKEEHGLPIEEKPEIASKRALQQDAGKVETDPAISKLREKESSQKAFLEEQIRKHQQEKLAEREASARKKKLRKRARSPVATRVQSKSQTMKDSFQAYMEEISREELLGQAEVMQLGQQIKQGLEVEKLLHSMERDLGRRPSVVQLGQKMGIEAKEVQRRLMVGTAAKNALVSANLRLVTSVARKVVSAKSSTKVGLALDDMVQEGSVGLLRAAEKFDASRGYRFSTYATWWIRAYVMRSITTQSRSIKVPSTIVDEYTRIRKEYSKLQEEGVFKPSDEVVARSLGITPAKMRFVIKVVTQVPASLDITLSSSNDSTSSRTLGEIVEGDDHVEEKMVQRMEKAELDNALRNCLKPIERAVIRLRFGLDDGQSRTLRETGVLLGLSKERIRQVIFRALPKLKTPEIQRMLTEATSR